MKTLWHILSLYRRPAGWLPEEEVCVQAGLHVFARKRNRLWLPGGSQPALQYTLLREADSECRSGNGSSH